MLCAQPPTPLLAELLAGRSRTQMYFGRIPEAVSDARQALEVARQAGYPAGEILALAQLSRTAHYAGDPVAALDWAREAQRVLASGELGWTMRFTGPFIIELLLESGDLQAARRSLADSLAWARETGNLAIQASSILLMADLDLRAGDLAGSGRHLREAIEIGLRTGLPARLLPRLDLLAHLRAGHGPGGDHGPRSRLGWTPRERSTCRCTRGAARNRCVTAQALGPTAPRAAPTLPPAGHQHQHGPVAPDRIRPVPPRADLTRLALQAGLAGRPVHPAGPGNTRFRR